MTLISGEVGTAQGIVDRWYRQRWAGWPWQETALSPPLAESGRVFVTGAGPTQLKDTVPNYGVSTNPMSPHRYRLLGETGWGDAWWDPFGLADESEEGDVDAATLWQIHTDPDPPTAAAARPPSQRPASPGGVPGPSMPTVPSAPAPVVVAQSLPPTSPRLPRPPIPPWWVWGLGAVAAGGAVWWLTSKEAKRG